ncbi:MAG: queuosine precursor transporter [Alphaproteobacteria bacterium]
MFDLNLNELIHYLHYVRPEYVWIINLIICYISIFILFRFWQKFGLYLYISIAIIACNLQVLKAVEFSWYNEPVALGTVTFASIFLANDMLTEIYGPQSAKKAVYLSFGAIILLLVLMMPALGLKPLSNNLNEDTKHFNEAHNALMLIFSPSLSILVASLFAYCISQLSDILIFAKLKKLTKNSHLWLRSFTSIAIAAMLDSVLFNLFAWKILAHNEVDWHRLFSTYITGAYIIQVTVAIINIPVFYLFLKFNKKSYVS